MEFYEKCTKWEELWECVKFVRRQAQPVGDQKIFRWFEKNLRQGRRQRAKENTGMPKAFLCDLDGTLAHHTGRDPFDYARVGEDEVDESVLDVIKALWVSDDDYEIIFISARPEESRKVTKDWLKKAGAFPQWPLLMRRSGDCRSDAIVKRELFEEHIEGKYRVMGIFEDRPAVVQMWRELGVRVFDVGWGVDF